MRTRTLDWFDVPTRTVYYGLECFVDGKWRTLCRKCEPKKPVVFLSEDDRDKTRRAIRKMKSLDMV